MRGPLTGLRVLDIATVLAGPYVASFLGDYGAEVLKVELPNSSDGLRNFPPIKDGKSLWWKVANRNKKMVTLDLRKPEGVDLFKRLLPRFDVLIENFRPGTLDRWGLDRDTLWALQPRLVILRVTAFGQTGPARNRPGLARVFEAMGGLTYITGEPDGQPMQVGFPIGDSIGGLFGAMGVLAALFRRQADPLAPGEEIDLSLTEAMVKVMDYLPIKLEQLGEVHERSGNTSQYAAPATVCQTRDGHWVSLSGSSTRLFIKNCAAIGRSDLPKDPRFATNAQRVANATELNEIFETWLAGQDLENVLRVFDEAGGTIAPIYSARQILEDRQLRDRNFLRSVPDSDFGTVCIPDVVPRFGRNPGSVRLSGGSAGQDNSEIYGEWLLMSPAEQARLRESGVI